MIAEGGVRFSEDISKAIAAGASSNRYFQDTNKGIAKEAPNYRIG